LNQLYYGDNLYVLRETIKSESVDLIYLDPPFNSSANYNVLFKSPEGEHSEAQITAFEDTWHWTHESARTLEQLKFKHGELAELLDLMVRQFGHNDLSAYLVMMAIRLVELHRVLKPTGSLYLHCDPTASHYLKMILDMVFGRTRFRNEIIWDYSFRLMDLPQFFNRKHDVILFYAKGSSSVFNMPKTEWTREEIIRTRKQKIHIDEKGEEWIWMPGGRGNSKNKLKRLTDIIAEGKAISDVWRIPIISSSSKERLGYPTQKPLILLERIIEASSNPGDIVMDCFCGCGTAVHAAQKLGRQWIGIDITHLAIALIEKRLKDAFPGIQFTVEGTPKDLDGARDLANRDKYQFQYWACSLVNAQLYKGKTKGADSGIDGQIFFTDLEKGKPAIKKIIVSVKGGGNVGSAMVRDLVGTVQRTKAEIGLFITLTPPTKPMEKEAAAAGFYRAGNGRDYPRIQILAIDDLLTRRKRPEYWDMGMGELTFKKAQRESSDVAVQGKLF
jgi:site-specific DNA-methyltransferase (adenine-specific)